MTEPSASLWQGRSNWARGRTAPLRAFLQTESGSAGVLVAAIAAALLWSNIDTASYNSVWHTTLSIRLGSTGITRDLQTWIDSGLMTLFFFVVGLEARREFDLGELRDRRQFVLPFVAGLVGMAIPVLIYLALNLGGAGAHGWGVAMSTDTALALGMLSLLGRDVPDRVRVFLLTIFVVDDLAALVVIAVVYSERIKVAPLITAIAAFALLLLARVLGLHYRFVYAVLGLVVWAALLSSGVDPVVGGLAIGLAFSAYSPTRGDLEEATGIVREFREQPTPALARTATARLISTLSPNARLQHFYHRWTSYVIVPLFALANAGIVINGGFLSHAYTSAVTLGVLLGYVVGKPVAIVGAVWAITRLTGGRVRPPVGWAAVLGSGTIAGIGFTVSLLIATRAFHGAALDEAKLGALSAALAASAITWIVYRVTGLLPPERRAAALLGDVDQIVDLIPPVDSSRDHVRGPDDASVTIVEYGDFECPYCGRAEPVVRDLLTDADLRYVWRHLPLTDVHPEAQLAAEAAEAASAQGAFWEMYSLLLTRQDRLHVKDLLAYADELGLDRDRFHGDLSRHEFAVRIAQDVESADLSGVSGTPTFFLNGQRHYGAYDIGTLSNAVKEARSRASIRAALH
jgi:Na+/H+ antiporter NhaA